MKFYIGVTDTDWFRFLSNKQPEDINFWQPGGKTVFKVLTPGLPFLFKLKSPINSIAGLGFFTSHTFLPFSIAWETFGIRNGSEDYRLLLQKILSYRGNSIAFEPDPVIGCIILTNPIFFKEEDWIPIPSNWSASIVQGKSYSTEEPIGKELWAKVNYTLSKYNFFQKEEEYKSQLYLEEPPSPDYKKVLSRVRLGQGAFRVLVTDTYNRRCSVTGERTLPVLEAAHIKPFADSGPYYINNGILLRSDLHKLFDRGYMTITEDYKTEISKRIKEEYENGKEYYNYHGKDLMVLPNRTIDKPSQQFIQYHNQHIYKG